MLTKKHKSGTLLAHLVVKNTDKKIRALGVKVASNLRKA
jgi:hypothetical protein